MESFSLFRLLHLAAAGLFAGSFFAVVMVQSLQQRALDGGERRVLARATGALARVVVNPLAYVAFFSGLLYWFARFSRFGVARLMKCTPIYVHVMLAAGTLAFGFAQMWKARARKLSAAMESGAPAEEVRAHATRGWIFALAALSFIAVAYVVAVLRVPPWVSPACFEDTFR